VTSVRHRDRLLLVTLVTVSIGGACAPDAPARGSSRIAGYSTMHDTMPEAIHEAKHRAVERANADVARSNTVEAVDARLLKIPDSHDAWLDFTLRRRTDGTLAHATDTLALLMNCNADSLILLDAQSRPVQQAMILQSGRSVQFRKGGTRVRVYGLRPMREDQNSETLVRTSRGGDLVLRTPLASDSQRHGDGPGS
jgi:hypothetical protein